VKSLKYCFVILCLFLAACGTAAAPVLPARIKDLQSKGKLIVGTAVTAPFEYHDAATNELVGFDVDLTRAIASRIGDKVEVEFKEIPFAELPGQLAAGNVDMVIAAMYITDARKQVVDFSQPYLDTGLVMVTKNTTDIKAPADLKGKMVGVKEGATGQTWAETLRNQQGVALEIRTYKTTLESLDDLDNGKIDVVLNDKLNTLEYIKTHPSIVVTGDVLSPAGLGIAVKKGDNDLRTLIDNTLSDMKKSGEIQKLYDKWISPTVKK
jgi:ABC-type amino acid transport substrate-binding protein